MSSRIKQIDFPVLPHLKKFIKKFHQVQSWPYHVELYTPVGIAMYSSITSKSSMSKRGLDRFTDSIQLTLCDDLSFHSVSNKQLIKFNTYYDRFFKHQLYLWVSAQYECGINNEAAVIGFLQYFNIKETELSLDVVYRCWQRHKSKEYQRLKLKKIAI